MTIIEHGLKKNVKRYRRIMRNHNYMNSAGSSVMSDRTVNIITDYLKLEQSIGGYESMVAKAKEFEQFYDRVVGLINANSADEIAFTDGGSRGWNALINGLDLNLIDSFVTLSSEYLTNISTLSTCADKYKKELHIIPCKLDGDFNIEAIEQIAQRGRCCICISQATAQGSIVNPIYDIGAIAKRTKSIYIVDATQSIGQIPLDVQKIQCDALTATGRKWLRGPRGTGFIYVREGAPFSTTALDGSSSKVYSAGQAISVERIDTARQFEMWERNYGIMLGLSNAIHEYMELGIDNAHNNIRSYANKIRAAVHSNPVLQLVGKIDSISGIVGIVTNSDQIIKEVEQAFKANNITFNLVYEWSCPLFFKEETKVIRLAAHHDVSPQHVEKVCKLLSEIGV